MIRAVFAAVAGLALVGVMAVPAQAKSPTPPPPGKTTWYAGYSKGYCFYSKPLKKALLETISGKVRYVRTAEKRSMGNIYVLFHDPTLINPKVDLRVATNCTAKRKTAKVSKAHVSQLWYDWKCNTHIRIILGRGQENWSIGLSGSRECGRTLTANRSTGYGSGSHFVQNNSGAPIGWNWGSGKRIDRGGKICLHADAGATAWVGNTSDTVVKPLSICVPASYAAKP
jgi:hypothetical protein